MRFIISTTVIKKIRKTLKWLWVGTLRCTGILAFVKRRIASQGGVIVLTFHRVLTGPEFFRTHSQNGLLVKDKTFEALSSYVRKRFQVVSLDEVASSANFNKRRLRIAFTFDDGWKDNFEYAAPIAQAHQIPMTLFVCTGKVDLATPFWPEKVSVFLKKLEALPDGIQNLQDFLSQRFGSACRVLALGGAGGKDRLIELLKTVRFHDREEILRKMFSLTGEEIRTGSDCEWDATMNWSDLESLRSFGITIGSHTRSHIVLTRVTPSEATQEVVQSKEEIERRLKTRCEYFAYPNGDWSQETLEVVRAAGYKLAFTNEEGIWTRSTNPFHIPRVNTWEGNLTNGTGEFSPSMFLYSAIWKAYRGQRNGKSGQGGTKLAEIARALVPTSLLKIVLNL